MNIAKKIRSFSRAEGGAALAEFAILVPFLVVMLAAVSELGRFFEEYSALAKGTRAASRYLSNVPYTGDNKDAAKNIVMCGKTTACADNEKVVKGILFTDIAVTETFPPAGLEPETVTVSVVTYTYTPVFNIGALLHNSFSLAVPVRPSTTMYYMVTEAGGAVD
ncbi:MAG TPA: TadE/TadG family type IV pilus assembly protein [Pyrinomonadaceae bacterium]|nr:TadE/TadG family type IV pilus assembly protein [Pyrinomonadaceae bacterium]